MWGNDQPIDRITCHLCQAIPYHKLLPQSKPGHVYRKFTWGNKRSLWDQPLAAGVNVRQAVMDYYKWVVLPSFGPSYTVRL